jgi:hypothetical protein
MGNHCMKFYKCQHCAANFCPRCEVCECTTTKQKIMTKYLILSLSHSTTTQPSWWREGAAGFTNFMVAAGRYTAETINSDPDYYNNGIDTLAVPLTDAGLNSIGFMETYSSSKALDLAEKVENGKKEVQP